MSSAITPPKVNQFRWNLEHCEHLCDNADDELFSKATLWSNHVLHALLPPTSASSQRYNLWQRPHLLQLPEHMTQLSDCSFFLIRMLYKDTYWLSFSFLFSCLFYIAMACVMSCLIKRRLIDWHYWGLALPDFGRDSRSSDTFERQSKFFCQVNN